MSTLYETDFYSWTQEQAQALRRAANLRINSGPQLDWRQLAREVEDLGRSLQRELYSRYAVLLLHLLKWRHQPSFRGASWELTIAHQRFELALLLTRNPGLKRKQAREFADAYQSARLQAAKETGLALASFPPACPFSRDQAADAAFWPEADA